MVVLVLCLAVEGSNKFTGQIPTEIATLTKLTRLVLRGNLLTGPVPMELAQLTNLTGLALNRNGLCVKSQRVAVGCFAWSVSYKHGELLHCAIVGQA